MNKLNKDEVIEYINKIMCGLGNDDEVAEWINKIAEFVPTSSTQVLKAIMEGKTVEDVFNKLYEADIIYL